jgi:hypothetical protein
MDQIRLGATGLQVSRVCLGMMSYGNDSDRPWALDEAAAEPIIRRAGEGGVTFFGHVGRVTSPGSGTQLIVGGMLDQSATPARKTGTRNSPSPTPTPAASISARSSHLQDRRMIRSEQLADQGAQRLDVAGLIDDP